MARFVLRGSIFKKILITVSCMLASAWVQTPVALAQHGGHVGGGGERGTRSCLTDFPRTDFAASGVSRSACGGIPCR